MFTSIGCFKEEFYEGSDIELRFSTDTLTFDTVFTTVGSATKIFKVYNDLDQAIKINKISIEDNKYNQFRLNIDGISSNSTENVEIGPNDSIYIFAEVNINPDDPLTVSPFVLEDFLVFETNGITQKILLEAWGQNANYVTGKGKGKNWRLTCESGEIVWDNPKPYVIYGSIYIDSCVLKLVAGTRVHIHGGIAKNQDNNFYYDGNLIFGKYGKLLSQGTAENPVIIQTDRLEQEYQDINALWYGLFFGKESEGSVLEYTTIKNASIGLYLDSLASVSLKSTKILHIGAVGIYSNHATLKAENCLIADIGGYNVVVDYGGSIDMTHCTIYNHNKDDALVLKNYKCLDPDCFNVNLNPLNANFQNCIIYGSNGDELLLSDANKEDPSNFNYFFDHCLLEVEDILKNNQFPNFFDHTVKSINGSGDENLFLNIDEYDYRPDTMSIVIDASKYITGFNLDIDGLSRDSKPDIGCYEFQK
jgi:hypothetical protein